jgi:hypothetical protein
MATVKWRNKHTYISNLDKSNQQMYRKFVPFLKMYLFIQHTDMFRLFLSHHQDACYIVQCKKTMCIFLKYGYLH